MNRDRWIIYGLSILCVVLCIILVSTAVKSQVSGPPYGSMGPPFGRDDEARAACLALLDNYKVHMQLLETHPDGTELRDAAGTIYVIDASFRAEIAGEIAVIDQLILDLQ